jgi:hypothetical protein
VLNFWFPANSIKVLKYIRCVRQPLSEYELVGAFRWGEPQSLLEQSDKTECVASLGVQDGKRISNGRMAVQYFDSSLFLNIGSDDRGTSDANIGRAHRSVFSSLTLIVCDCALELQKL